jgi:hypothetical protein
MSDGINLRVLEIASESLGLLDVEGAGEHWSMSSSSSEKSWVERDSSSAPADDEPETEEEH